jgi:hypothetical protein
MDDFESQVLDECKKHGYSGYAMVMFGDDEDYVAAHGEGALIRAAIYLVGFVLEKEEKNKDMVANVIVSLAKKYVEGKYGER